MQSMIVLLAAAHARQPAQNREESVTVGAYHGGGQLHHHGHVDSHIVSLLYAVGLEHVGNLADLLAHHMPLKRVSPSCRASTVWHHSTTGNCHIPEFEAMKAASQGLTGVPFLP
eukprot:scaffold492633_cov33-Prasinocladus_malaysianus.AAC.2